MKFAAVLLLSLMVTGALSGGPRHRPDRSFESELILVAFDGHNMTELAGHYFHDNENIRTRFNFRAGDFHAEILDFYGDRVQFVLSDSRSERSCQRSATSGGFPRFWDALNYTRHEGECVSNFRNGHQWGFHDAQKHEDLTYCIKDDGKTPLNLKFHADGYWETFTFETFHPGLPHQNKFDIPEECKHMHAQQQLALGNGVHKTVRDVKALLARAFK